MTDIDVWRYFLGYATHNSTVEISIGGQRMVFTADPENIRAILATQFGDYGKGEPFHEGPTSILSKTSECVLICYRLERVSGRFDLHN